MKKKQDSKLFTLKGITSKLTRDEMKKVLGGGGYVMHCGGCGTLSSNFLVGCAICFHADCPCG